ncbi:hypothetical protein ABPG75_011604 [Micractinium tetrahymenae]
MDLLPPAELLPPLGGLSPPAAPGSGSGGHRRCASAPSLSVEAVADAVLQLETTPCSVLELHSLDDDVSLSLKRTLQDAQRELLEAMQAGVLKGSGEGGAGPGWQGPHSEDTGGGSGSSGRSQAPGCAQHPGCHHQQQQAGGGSDAAQGGDTDAGLELELELSGLPAQEREAALKRFKNREAARRSRERKAERISGLQAEVDRLRANNFVLLKCVEEVAHKALAARGEQRRLRDKLAKLQAEQQQAAPAGTNPQPALAPTTLGLPLPADAGACTPPAATRAAALERQLLEMEAGPSSPTQLLLPRWPQQAAAPASVPLQPRPTSAELRRELRRAVVGEQGAAACGDGMAAGGAAVAAQAVPAHLAGAATAGAPAAGSAWPSSAADLHHLLHPSPVAASRSRRPLQPTQHEQQQGAPHLLASVLQPDPSTAAAAAACPAALLANKGGVPAGGPGLLRTCSDPGDLAAAFADLHAMPAGPAGPQAGGAAPPAAWFLPGLVV